MKKMEKFEISDTNNIYDISKCVEFKKGIKSEDNSVYFSPTLPDDFVTILEDIPEYHNDDLDRIVVTNVGILEFIIKKRNEKGDVVSDEYEYVGYNLLEKPDEFNLSELKPDFTSTLIHFTEYNNPLGVRRIPVNKKDRSIGTKIYKTGNSIISLIDCDYIKENKEEISPSNGVFIHSERFKSTVYIGFDYKQSRTFKFVNCSGEMKHDNTTPIIDETEESTITVVDNNYYIMYGEGKSETLGTKGKKIYFSGSINKNKLVCSENESDAVKLYIDPINGETGRYYMYIIDNEIKKYLDIDDMPKGSNSTYELQLSENISDATHFLFSEELRLLY